MERQDGQKHYPGRGRLETMIACRDNEHEAHRLRAQGLTHTEIARILCVRRRTATRYLSRPRGPASLWSRSPKRAGPVSSKTSPMTHHPCRSEYVKAINSIPCPENASSRPERWPARVSAALAPAATRIGRSGSVAVPGGAQQAMGAPHVRGDLAERRRSAHHCAGRGRRSRTLPHDGPGDRRRDRDLRSRHIVG